MTALDRLREQNFLERLRRKDATLWSADPKDHRKIESRLGWLTIHKSIVASLPEIEQVGAWVREAGFQRAVLLGMGGSSLAPEVFHATFGAAQGHPELTVLDTTDPFAIARLESRIDVETTVFIVSSKSGTTIETSSLQRYFEERTRDATGDTGSLDNFVAITDPDTQLHHYARDEGYHKVFLNPPDIGGRFSALSFFGLVPAAVIGVDVSRILEEADTLDWEEALTFGAQLADFAAAGRDKLTFLPGETLRDFGAWAEQLVAESTGKDGNGIVPVDRETPGVVESYGDDRVFILASGDAEDGSDLQDGLRSASHPVLEVEIDDPYQLGREFLRWEIATTVAGHAIGIYPFDEPNVEESKENTRHVLEEYVRSGSIPDGEPIRSEPEFSLFAPDPAALRGDSIAGAVASHLGRGAPGPYGAILAFIAPGEEHDRLLVQLRTAVRDATRMAVTAAYGPRFLHSSGQLHKGGPSNGIFLQITTDDATDEDIPGESGFGFSALKAAQALGDYQALASRGLDILRVHLRGDTTSALRKLVGDVEAILRERKGG
jgi:glucose-6-phosphate isomerase